MNRKSNPDKSSKNIHMTKGRKLSLHKRKHGESSSQETLLNETEIKDDTSSTGSMECVEWDVGCLTLPIITRPNSIIGFNLGNGLQPAEGYLLEERSPRQLKLLINSDVTKSDFKRHFRRCWLQNIDYKTPNTELSNIPFKYCVIDDFFENVSFLDKVRHAFNEIDWNKRKMDLYEFFQSDDLKHVNNTYIKKIHDFFKKELHRWISDVTEIKIEKISFTCSFYSFTDFLLLHDDLQRDRAIAFILYMTDPKQKSNEELWTPDMGGRLLLYDKDEFGRPKECVKTVTPKNNRFLFFPVTNDSFHQVEEVLNMDHCRYSINGWFHMKEPNPYLSLKLKSTPSVDNPENVFKEALDSNVQLHNWIYGSYLIKDVRAQIQQQIEAESEISLSNYFIKETYEDLYEALQSDDIEWEKVGPLTRNNYEVIKIDTIPFIVKDFLLLFRSPRMFKLLRDYTHLELTIPDGFKGTNPMVRIELQRWTPGSYSMMSDMEDPHLDIIVYIGCQNKIVGGETMYVANDVDVEQALVSVQPTDNTLDLIYRDTPKFTRYVSFTSQKEFYYTLICSYKELKH